MDKNKLRLLRKAIWKDKMPFWFVKLCFTYHIEFNSWQYNVLKSFVLNGFTIIPKNGNTFKQGDYECVCVKKTASSILRFNLSITYPWIAWEVFCEKYYGLKNTTLSLMTDQEGYNLIDIGGNRGYSSLWFAMQDWCKKIFTFELCPQTCKRAQDNFSMNPNLSSKITFYQYGLVDSNLGGGK